MILDARRTGLSVSRTAMLLGFHSQQFPVCTMNYPPPKGHPANLTQLWGSIGVNMGQHHCGTLSTPCNQCLDKLRLFWGQKGVQLNIRKVFLMFCTLSVYTHYCVYTHTHSHTLQWHSPTNSTHIHIHYIHTQRIHLSLFYSYYLSWWLGTLPCLHLHTLSTSNTSYPCTLIKSTPVVFGTFDK